MFRMMGSSNFSAGANVATGTFGPGYGLMAGIGLHQPATAGTGIAAGTGVPGFANFGMMGGRLLNSGVTPPAAPALPDGTTIGSLHQTMVDFMQDIVNGTDTNSTAVQSFAQTMLDIMDDMPGAQLIGQHHAGMEFIL